MNEAIQVPPGSKMYYRNSDSEPWKELGNIKDLDPADGADRTAITVVDGTTTISIRYDPAEVSRLIQKLGTNAIEYGDPLGPSPVTKARALLEGKPVPKGVPITANHVAKRNDPCPCGSGRKYKKCHLGN